MKTNSHSRLQTLMNLHKRVQKTGRFWQRFLLAAIVIFSATVAAIGYRPSTAVADSFSPPCQTNGYLFQYNGAQNQPPTKVWEVDLITNDISPTPIQIPEPPQASEEHTINAIGYNVKDNFIWGWNNRTSALAKVHSGFQQVDSPTVTGDALPPIGIIAAGDVDNNGHYWFSGTNGSGGFDWYRIDVSTATPSYTTGDTGALYGGANTGPPDFLGPEASKVTEPLDWVYVPPTFLNNNNDNKGGLYTIVINKPDANPANQKTELYRFDTTNLAAPWELIGELDIPVADGQVGALYADAAGTIYAGSNTGKMWHIIIGNSSLGIDLTTIGPTQGESASGNDGARCANANIPADLGDAPSSYGTTLSEIGPLHLLGAFDEIASTAELMLGSVVDMEDNGYPTADAKGDDNNHNPGPYINDEESVQHIVAPPTPVDLRVPVEVTNNIYDEPIGGVPATLVGWIDTDDDGSFFDEQKVTKTIQASSGTGTYELTFPNLNLAPGTETFARFRVFKGTGLSDDQTQPAGIESSFAIGEVEDYTVQVGTFKVNKTADPPEGSAVEPGETLTYTLDITNTGTSDLDDLTVHDDLSDVLDDATLEGNPTVNPSAAGGATVTDNTLEFKGDVLTGQTVTVTYTVKVKPFNELTNKTMRNYVIAAQSNCHPTIRSDNSVTVEHPDCNTHHQIGGLADTGTNIILPLSLAIGLVGASGATLYFGRRRFVRRRQTTR